MNATVKLLELVLPATVSLQVEVPEEHPSAAILGTTRLASGVIIDPDGLVLTVNYAVLRQSHRGRAARRPHAAGPAGGARLRERPGRRHASLTVHRPRPEKANGAAAVICPGGAYGGLVVGPEGHGIAQWLNQYGIAGIVLEYRLPGGRPFVPLLYAQRAIRTVRARAKAWNVDPNRIGIIGFSAGGHLASTAGTHFDGGDPRAADPIDRVSCRPDFMILVYPVITMTEKTHSGSKANLLGRGPKAELLDLFSNEKQVTAKTPPTFLAHAQDDTLVTPDNSRVFFEALQSHQVAAEYLQLPSGGHGLNGYQGPMWDAWQTQSLEWLAKQKMIPYGDKPIRSVPRVTPRNDSA